MTTPTNNTTMMTGSSDGDGTPAASSSPSSTNNNQSFKALYQEHADQQQLLPEHQQRSFRSDKEEILVDSLAHRELTWASSQDREEMLEEEKQSEDEELVVGDATTSSSASSTSVINVPNQDIPTPTSTTANTNSSSSNPANNNPDNTNTANKNNNLLEEKKKTPLCPPWTQFTEGFLHPLVCRFVVAMATHAANHPFAWIGSVMVFSFAVAIGGFFSPNFYLELDQRAFLTPSDSNAKAHSDWINSPQSGFEPILVVSAAIHANGQNVLTAQAMRQAIQTIQTVFEAPDYHEVCSQGRYLDYHTDEPTCRIFTVTQFWNHNLTLLEDKLAHYGSIEEQDEYIRKTISGTTFPDGTPVFHEAIIGNYQNETTGTTFTFNFDNAATTSQDAWILTNAQSLLFKIDLPDLGEPTDKLEAQLMDVLGDLRKEYHDKPVQVEYFTLHSINTEFQRAMNKDLPLVVALIVVMVSFTCIVFYNPNDKVHSHAILGHLSFLTIGMSLLSGYGIMFLAGVPMCSVGTMIPFVVTGVALDDTFIITGAFFRYQRDHPKEQRTHDDTIVTIRAIMADVGVSISMTTCTTLVCFLLGSTSSIPAVRWLCYYSATTIAIDFIYQITFFVALLTLNERRVQENRRDLFFWIVVPPEDPEDDQDTDAEKESKLLPSQEDDDDDDNEKGGVQSISKPAATTPTATTSKGSTHGEQQRNVMERFMTWYAQRLLKPWVKAVVIVVFLAYFAACCYSTSLLHQEFIVSDYVPRDSMITGYLNAIEDYASVQRFIEVYFRNVDQSDPAIRAQMSQYVQELGDLPQIGEPPYFFWVHDFEQLASSDQVAELGINTSALTFNQQIDLALSVPEIRQIYAQDIVRDEASGNITASRTFLYLRNIDMKDIQNQQDMLLDQREITEAQPINAPENQKNGELAFFSFEELYFFWELYIVVVDELIFTTVSCVVAVSVIALVFIPHWSAMAFVTPLIIMLYFMLLGTMQFCGMKIHSITYFIIVLAIGLLVDFLMHVLLRYYETKGTSRHAKVKETLESMGASILLGGFTTWLGVIPLAFSSTKIFMTVFISFLAMVTLGLSVGLAFLPVLLSIVGPTDSLSAPSIQDSKNSQGKNNQSENKSSLDGSVVAAEA